MSDKEKDSVIASLLSGMESVLNTKTVVGEPTVVGDTTIIPLMDVSFGVAAGSGTNGKKTSDSGVGGLGGKMTPSAILVIHNGTTRLISVKNQDNLTKALDMIPELVNRFTKKKDDELSDEEIKENAFPEETSTVESDPE